MDGIGWCGGRNHLYSLFSYSGRLGVGMVWL